jgi:ferrochelatase
MSFNQEPASSDKPARTAVLLINLGSPDAPTPAAVRRYLAEFLADPRVVEIPRLLWWPILHSIVLRTRPRKSAAKYAGIWTAEGSPLAVWTARQATLLTGYLGERGQRVLVRHAMRYGSPGIGEQLDQLKAEGATRVLLLPLYPQYASATTGSMWDAVARWAQRTRVLPELRCVQRFHDDAGYLDALARRITDHWMREGRPDKLVMSFHGLPARTVALGDPYHRECLETARLLAERLGLRDDAWLATFQSRFGKAKWLQPYTEPTLRRLARDGVARVDVVCPGFMADCLETLEEIAVEGRNAFITAGGKSFHYIACLNDSHPGMLALTQLTLRHLQGWA